jgi:hypothetical protein
VGRRDEGKLTGEGHIDHETSGAAP